MRGLSFALFLLAAAVRAVEPSPGTKPFLVLPDADGVLDVAAAQRARTFDAIPNPFRDRSHPPPPTGEVTLAIHSVLIPSRPEDACVVLNGRLYSVGDRIEGLELALINAENLEFRSDGLVVRVPVGDQPVRFRLTR